MLPTCMSAIIFSTWAEGTAPGRGAAQGSRGSSGSSAMVVPIGTSARTEATATAAAVSGESAVSKLGLGGGSGSGEGQAVREDLREVGSGGKSHACRRSFTMSTLVRRRVPPVDGETTPCKPALTIVCLQYSTTSPVRNHDL